MRDHVIDSQQREKSSVCSDLFEHRDVVCVPYQSLVTHEEG